MSDTPRMDRAANESLVAVYEQGCQLERELAEVTKQRDALVNAIRKHKTTLVFMPDYCDELLYKALEELAEGGAQ